MHLRCQWSIWQGEFHLDLCTWGCTLFDGRVSGPLKPSLDFTCPPISPTPPHLYLNLMLPWAETKSYWPEVLFLYLLQEAWVHSLSWFPWNWGYRPYFHWTSLFRICSDLSPRFTHFHITLVIKTLKYSETFRSPGFLIVLKILLILQV